MKQELLFPIQSVIQEWLDGLLPLEVTLNDETISKLDEQMIISCKEFHAFITGLYTDIYKNPAEYGFTNEDNETNGRAAALFHIFIFEMIPDGELINNTIRISYEVFDKKVNRHNAMNKLFKKTPYSAYDRLLFLQRFGLCIKKDHENIYVTNTQYPNIFSSLQKMRQASVKNYAGSVVYRNCEFRLIANPKYEPDLSDITYKLLSHEAKDLIFKIDAYAKQKKIKTQCRVKESLYYMYKGKMVMDIVVHKQTVLYIIHIGNSDYINQMFESYSDDFQQFITKHLNYCSNCIPSHGGGRKVTLSGRKVHICSTPSLKVFDPSPDQFEIITQAINIGCNAIDNNQASRN